MSKLARFLSIPTAPGCKNKKVYVNSGARVLTSVECIQMLEERREGKKMMLKERGREELSKKNKSKQKHTSKP